MSVQFKAPPLFDRGAREAAPVVEEGYTLLPAGAPA